MASPHDLALRLTALLAFSTTTALASHLPFIGRDIYGSTPAQKACNYLSAKFPNATHFPNTTYYDTDNTDFWSQASALGPACDFAPSRAEDLGWGVKVLTYFQSPFAMRGGGHMPIGDYNNINSSGVLLSSSGFTQLKVEADGESMHTGPGNHWVDVYRFLEPYGKTVVGGRLGVVGIPGFITGGGMSFFSWQHGWSSNNIKSFTGVLASGEVVTATPTNAFADLFWALRGGGNSFMLVTDIEMITYAAPVVTLGITQHGTAAAAANSSTNTTDLAEKYIDVLYDFSLNKMPLDTKASIIPIINTGNIAPYNGQLSYTTYRFYDANDTAPASLANFTSSLPVVSDTFAPKTMYQWSEETSPQFAATVGLRQRFYIIPFYISADTKDVFRTVVDTYFTRVDSALAELPLWFTGLSPIPVSTHFLAASYAHSSSAAVSPIGGDPMGVAPEREIFFTEIALSYANDARYEEIVTAFLEGVHAEILAALEAKGLQDEVSEFLYLNDADKGQDVWGGYPKENVERLQEIRSKYDPERVLTDLMRGGWKVADYEV